MKVFVVPDGVLEIDIHAIDQKSVARDQHGEFWVKIDYNEPWTRASSLDDATLVNVDFSNPHRATLSNERQI